MSATSDGSSQAQDRMLGSVPGASALGRGPAPDGFSRHEYDHPAAGWGAARSVGKVLEERGTPTEGVRALFVMNQEDDGFDCPGCAWPDDPSGLHLDICENGVKHVTWELARKQVGRGFFAAHTVSELGEFDLVDITSYSKDGGSRAVYGYRAVRYEIPRGCAAGYMPELNVLCGIADYSTASGQPVTKHLQVEITASRP